MEQAKTIPMTPELRKAIEAAERFTNRSAFKLYNDTYGEIEARGAGSGQAVSKTKEMLQNRVKSIKSLVQGL